MWEFWAAFSKTIFPLQTHSYTILPLLAAQLLHHFTPSILHCFSPHSWRLPVMNRQPLYPQLVLLNLHTTNACSTLDGLYIRIILVRIAPSHQINLSHIPFHSSEQITPKLLHLFAPLAALLLPHFNPSEQITPSLLHHFTPLGSQLLAHFTPSE